MTTTTFTYFAISVLKCRRFFSSGGEDNEKGIEDGMW